MGKRKCPLCFVRVPWTEVLAHSEEIRCPACHAVLELSRFTRVFAGFGGIAGAFWAVHATRGIFPGTYGVSRVVAAILAFGIASAACVLIAGDLVVRPKTSAPTFPQAVK